MLQLYQKQIIGHNLLNDHPHLIIDAFRSLVTPPSTTNTKHNSNNTTANNNNFHSTSLTTTSKQYSKYD